MLVSFLSSILHLKVHICVLSKSSSTLYDKPFGPGVNAALSIWTISNFSFHGGSFVLNLLFICFPTLFGETNHSIIHLERARSELSGRFIQMRKTAYNLLRKVTRDNLKCKHKVFT